MKITVERGYWAVVAFIVIVTVADAASILWSTFVQQVGHPLWRDLVDAPASWLLPRALMSGVLSLMSVVPERASYVIRGSLAFLTLTPLALAAWFYLSRRAPLRLRVTAVAGLIVLGVAVRLLVLHLLEATT